MTEPTPIDAIDEFDAYLFDLDGTIYLGEGLLPGAQRLVETLRAHGKRVLFCSNNPTKSPQDYADRLARLGLPTPVEDVYTSLVATVHWIEREMPGKVVFPIGEQPLVDALAAAGIPMSDDPERIDLVISSYDRTFEYRKLQIAFDALWFHERARLVTTNPDRFCPFPGGRGEPDAACITAAITAGTQVECEAVFGKPSKDLFDIIQRDTGIDPARTVMVGDRLSTDMLFARNSGIASALVMTGETDDAMLAAAPDEHRPDIVLGRIDHLVDAFVDADREARA
ncbi:HAD-IIA family hydrolase [Agrococcus jejuensis]|uniref:Haloacid Dehalogenase Superfamily Class (Subfamily) IIA n=1 Tax=Agrococcus jejuensis TaxID=399736 RepID=A0A1G8FBR4_9MICO|nr:HAD-IIA family hydrolase [Agrococcus jejuensis]SDH79591.1 Haloacid Dehalogenase Superfamily Class (subfamily) IIA [Agrococcus jejuensis]